MDLEAVANKVTITLISIWELCYALFRRCSLCALDTIDAASASVRAPSLSFAIVRELLIV